MYIKPKEMAIEFYDARDSLAYIRQDRGTIWIFNYILFRTRLRFPAERRNKLHDINIEYRPFE